MRRRKMGKRESRRSFSRASGTKGKNVQSRPMRGGYRM